MVCRPCSCDASRESDQVHPHPSSQSAFFRAFGIWPESAQEGWGIRCSDYRAKIDSRCEFRLRAVCSTEISMERERDSETRGNQGVEIAVGCYLGEGRG